VRKDITYEDLTIALKERRKINRTYVEDHQMSYNPAQLESIVMDGLRSIYPRLAVKTLGEFAPHLLIPVKDIPWNEKPVDNAMLRDSMKVVASGDIPTYTGTFIEAYVDGDVYSTLILEPTKDILSWMDQYQGEYQDTVPRLSPWSASEGFLLLHST
jgi:hypothetical protein